MESDYDSGDDLFEGVNQEELYRPIVGRSDNIGQDHGQKRKSEQSQGYDALHPGRDAVKRQKSLISLSESPEPESESAQNASRRDLARQLLSEKFGYEFFRYEQEAAILRVLAGENTLVVFPTGAGKSLCYQVLPEPA